MRKVLAVTVVALCLAATACDGSGSRTSSPVPGPPARPTSVDQLDPATMRVVRVAFCDLVPKAAVHAALDAAPTASTSWHNGDPLPVAGGETGHEFGCSWRGPQGRVARAWVFAHPVSPAYAATLVRLAAKDPGCGARAGAGFGAPSLTQTCLRRGAPPRIRLAGLFADTWLSCEVSGQGDPAVLRGRAEAWCVSVVNALDAG